MFAADIKQPGHCGSLSDGPYVLKGREDKCEQIITSLMSNKAVEIVAPPGYGKTSVVVEATHRLISMGSFVAYVNPRGVTCVEDFVVESSRHWARSPVKIPFGKLCCGSDP